MTRKRRILTMIWGLLYLFTVIFSVSGCANGGEISGEAAQTDSGVESGKQQDAAENAPEEAEEAMSLRIEDKGIVQVPFEPIQYKASVPAYKIGEDLSNVENLGLYGAFTDAQKQMLAKNGFVVTPGREEQLFYIYENNEYLKLPSFVTVDSVLQVYHVFYDYSLRRLENGKLIAELDAMTQSMLRKSVALYNRLENERLKALQLKNAAYFGVGALALGMELPSDMPEKARDMAGKEFELLKGQKGFQESVLFPFQLDYSQYKPRGHYTRSDELKRYFNAMMWYGQAPFPLYGKDGERNEGQTLEALLMTYSLLSENGEDLARWRNIYEPTAFYVGKADDLSVLDYYKLLVAVYGEKPDIEHLDDPGKLERLYAEAKKLPEPAIKPKYATVSTPAGKQFRFMGQRYIADSEILQELVEPIARPVPMGLDVMGVLGSERAEKLLFNTYKEDKKWPEYKPAYEKMKKKFEGLEQDKWQSNMYSGWLWMLKGLLHKYGAGYPGFMQTGAWQDKSLNTALGSWAELRHDTVLYGKGSAAECGGGEEPPKVRGYVEPNIEVYEKLLWLTRYSRENLKQRGLLEGELESRMERFEEILGFLIGCSVKELNNEALSDDEYYQLLTYGGMLEYLTSSFMEEGYKWYQITSETDRNMAVISDVHTLATGGCLEAGVGPAYEIYVIVPVEGKLYLTRGAVFSYYEFLSGERLTDEAWQKMLKENKQPEQPEWMKSFVDETPKNEVPVPAEPYSSGC